MLNSLTLNGSGRALWVRSATVLATATALAVAATYGYQQRGEVLGDARVTVTLVTQRATFGTTFGQATAGALLAATKRVGGQVTGSATTFGLAAVYRLVPVSCYATATAMAVPILAGELGLVAGVAAATADVEAVRVQFLAASALTAATGAAAGDVIRYATLMAPLAGSQYARAETTLALVADNPWNNGGSWDDGWQWSDTTVWRHEGFVPLANALVTVTFDNLLTDIIATVGPYGFSQSYVPSMRAFVRQSARSSAPSLTLGVLTPTLTTWGTVTATAGATGQTTAVRTIPTAATHATADTLSWVTAWRRYAATAFGVSEATGEPVTGDHNQAGRSLGNGGCVSTATPGNFYPAGVAATSGSTALAVPASKNHAARVLESGIASGVLLRADWAHNYQVTAAALAGALVSGAATATGEYVGAFTTTLTASGLAIPSAQIPAGFVAAAGVTSRVDADALLYATLSSSSTATGTAFALSMADVPATPERVLVAIADARSGSALMDDRVMRVTR